MATKTKSPTKRAAKTKVPAPFDDLHTQADDQAVPNQFVEITEGPHKGTYGVLVGQASETDVIVRSRDADSARIVVPYKSVKPSEPGKR